MNFKLLVVEDEPIVRRGIRELIDFEQLGISECRETSDGLEASQLIKDYSPDIVLTDINMPKLDGLSFAWELKRSLPSARIILITGYDYFEYAREAVRLGVDDFILKPVSKKEITEILKTATDKLREQRKSETLQKAVADFAGLSDNQGTNESEYIPKIIKSMENHYQNPDFDLKALSDILSLSQGYISRLFRSAFGKTFPEYLNELRLERARILIIGSSMKIYEITEKCGFSDANYFSISFKKKFGSPPNKYREMLSK